MQKGRQNGHVIRFGVFEADLMTRELRKRGVRVRLQEQPFRLLQALLERPGQIVTREEIKEKLWPDDTFVDFDSSLNTAAQKLRQALGDSAESPRFMETIPRRGYRFVGLGASSSASERVGWVPSRWAQVAPWVTACLACIFGVAIAWLYIEPTQTSRDSRARRFAYQPPRRLSGGPSVFQAANVAISPDGNRVAYVGVANGSPRLIVRDLRSDEQRSYDGTSGAYGPFFSPDSEHLGFFANGTLKRVDLESSDIGEIVSVLPVSNGGVWADDGNIYFALFPRSGIKRVSAAGGEFVDVTTPLYDAGEVGHLFPHLLPDQETILYSAWNGLRMAGTSIQAISLATGQRRTVVSHGTSPRYSRDGYLVYADAGSVLAVPFDPDQLTVRGPPTMIAEGVSTYLGSAYDISAEGTLVYEHTGSVRPSRRLVRVNRDGTSESFDSANGLLTDLAVSPDGTRVAVGKIEAAVNLWTKSVGPRPSPLEKLTFTDGLSFGPVWTPDNQHVAYAQAMLGMEPPELFWKPSDGSGEAELLFEMPYAQFPSSFSPDARILAFNHEDPATNYDIFVLDISTSQARPFRNTKFNEGMAKFHRSGKWVAYHSDQSGQYEVYLAEFPNGTTRQVSRAGGSHPVWSPDGGELMYRSGDEFWLTAVSLNPELEIGAPELLFERPHRDRGNYADSYGIDASGSVLTIDLDPAETKPSEISIVLNWQGAL